MIGLGSVDASLCLPLILAIKARMPKRTISTFGQPSPLALNILPFHYFFNIPPVNCFVLILTLDSALTCRRLLTSLTVSLRDDWSLSHVISLGCAILSLSRTSVHP